MLFRQAEQGFEALNKYCIDLTALAEEGKLDPVIGRDNEIRRMIRVLSRRTKNNPVLVGKHSPNSKKTLLFSTMQQDHRALAKPHWLKGLHSGLSIAMCQHL